MLEQWISLDQQWLLAINAWNAPWADEVMWLISSKFTWIPLYVLLIILLIIRYRQPMPHSTTALGKRIPAVVWIILAIVLTIVLSDQVSGIIKHSVCRFRPTHEPSLCGLVHIVQGYTGGLYGFVSSHAANTMACALLFCLIWQHSPRTKSKYSWFLMLFVALNCYSRMYLGVHYPLDILGGLLLGSMIAVIIYLLLCRIGVLDE